MSRRWWALWLPLLVLPTLTGCRSELPPTVVLISIDGFRADYMDRLEPPTLGRLADEGAWADEGMLPVFPSKTFPNHYSIATGLYPAHHGIVANTMYDSTLGRGFRISDRSAVEDPAWWGGEPLWVTAEKQGVTAANFYWVGSEAPVQGRQSTYWKRFDNGVPGEARVDTVLAWLDLPADVRPRFITLYFETLDSNAHRSGPWSQDAEEAVRRVDGYIGRLVDGLKRRGSYDEVDIVVVSDHGMADVSPDSLVFIEDYVDPRSGWIHEYSPVLLWTPDSEDIAMVEEGLDRMPHVTRLGAAVLDSVFHYTGNVRIAPVVALVDEGWTLVSTREEWNRRRGYFSYGMHGFDPRLPSQRALFVARGPSFKPGARLEPFENIDVYPLLSHVLGLDPAPVDGSMDRLLPALRH